MQRVLFHSTIFGPIHSRRLGTSLGVNLSPTDGKVCSFDCLYCEAGFNAQGTGSSGLPERRVVKELLEERLARMKAAGDRLDVITFSGNGEPTMHPEFGGVIDDTIELRDKYFPQVKISVLSNATRLADSGVCAALLKVDNNILKLDSALTQTMVKIDRPVSPKFSSEGVIKQLAGFGNNCIVQTMMLRGSHNGEVIDNTTEEEIEALIAAYKEIRPAEVMLYSLDRKTPEEALVKVEKPELEEIARKIESAGIKVLVS